jgi:hypothetical protein
MSKKNKKKANKMNQVGFNVAPVKKIVDVVSNNHFGLLLTTQKQIEDFQTKSGMMKKYVSEYQYHYWALVGRVKLGSDVLDIAIPTAVFNYKQTVSSGAVGFHLNDVETESNNAKSIAEQKSLEIINGDLGRKITEMLPIIEWIMTPFNTCHVHPGQLASFSGTDYSKTINDPGIVFPLDEPSEQASFSSILCHSKDNSARMVRTEYRFANFEEGNNVYKHGVCVQYVKGYREEYTEEMSPIAQMFFGEPKAKVKEVEDYHMKDRCDDRDMTGSFIEKIVEIFKDSDYEPDTSLVFESNIIKEPKIVVHSVNHYNVKGKSPSVSSLIDYADNFEEMRDVLVEEGYMRSQVMSWGYDTLVKFYNRVLGEREERTKDMVPTGDGFFINDKDPFEEDDGYQLYEYKKDEKVIEFLIDNGFSKKAIKNMSEESIENVITILGY